MIVSTDPTLLYVPKYQKKNLKSPNFEVISAYAIVHPTSQDFLNSLIYV